MSLPTTSVVVVSRGRPDHLHLCLSALALQDHPAMEIVLVADPEGLRARADLAATRIPFDRANISVARNLGIAAAAGEVVAFIDDDALALPGWARRLSEPFADPRVTAATGWTLGPDGRSWQARGQRITAAGVTIDLDLPGDRTCLLGRDGTGAVSTIGTNSAFRADRLRRLGGFDPAFAYYLDESDLNMRMAAAWPSALTAVVPAARVVHGLARNRSRPGPAAPGDLSVVGHSAALFAARHAGEGAPARLADKVVAEHRRRLLRAMLAGRLDPLHVAPSLASLREGLRGGASAGPPPLPRGRIDADRRGEFVPFPGPTAEPLGLRGWIWQAGALRRRARAETARGRPVHLLLLTPSALPHRLRMSRGGWFEQTGGLWGPSRPEDPPLQLCSPASRARREWMFPDPRVNNG